MGIGSEHKYNVHSVVRSNINSLERQVNELKKELSNMKADIQKLKKTNQTLENKITNAPTIGSSRKTTSAKSRPIGRILPQIWQVNHRVDDDGVEWAEDEMGDWYYRRPGESDWTEWIA